MKRIVAAAFALLPLFGSPCASADPAPSPSPTDPVEALSNIQGLIVQNYGPVACSRFEDQPTAATLVRIEKELEANQEYGPFTAEQAASMVIGSINKWCPDQADSVNNLLGVASPSGTASVDEPVYAQGTIDQIVQNMRGQTPESRFIAYLWENGFGYLDIQRVWDDGNIACQNRKAGVPPTQVIPLLQSRGYSESEAQALVIAETTAIGDRLSGPVC